MKLLIDIDKKEFINIQNLSDYYIDFRFFSLETIAILAIKNGTPYETVTEFADRCRECGAKYGKLLKPKTGHWIKVSDGYGDNAYICECSECKDTVWVYKDADRKWNFCPNCGAKMVDEKESEDKE